MSFFSDSVTLISAWRISSFLQQVYGSGMEKLIMTCAITGAEVVKSEHPQLPVTPEEQANAATEAVRAGAAVIHLHVRDDKANPSQEPVHFKRSVAAIRSAIEKAVLSQPILQFSTGGAIGETMGKRILPLSLKPEMASFNLGTMNFGNDIFVNTRPGMRELAKAFRRFGVVPEFEIYDLSHTDELRSLIKEKLVESPYHVQFVLGVPGGAMPFSTEAPTEDRILYLISQLPKPFTWAVAGIGRFERPCAEIAIQLGGHVRVGLEDNLYIRKGVLAQSNSELVSDVVAIANGFGRKVATAEEARSILGLFKNA